MTPTLGPIRRVNGIAGQISYSVQVTYPHEQPRLVSFVSSVYGGPVVMCSPTFGQLFVTDPSRFGEFGPAWVRRFFTNGEEK